MACKVTHDDPEEFRKLNRRINKKIVETFDYIAETAVTECKKHHTYEDQTGKLTASMGYVMKTPNGTTINMMEAANYPGDPEKVEEGGKVGKEYAKKVATDINGADWGVAICAGAEYAHKVSEKRKVLEPAEPILKRLSERLFNALEDVN